MVEVPLGKVHVYFAQETVPAKGVVMPDGENECLGSNVVHVNTILWTGKSELILFVDRHASQVLSS